MNIEITVKITAPDGTARRPVSGASCCNLRSETGSRPNGSIDPTDFGDLDSEARLPWQQMLLCGAGKLILQPCLDSQSISLPKSTRS